jgi:hypothetical protein
MGSLPQATREEKSRKKSEESEVRKDLNIRTTNRLLLVALALAASVAAKDAPPAWEQGRVVSQNYEAAPGGGYAVIPLGTAMIGAPIMRRSNTVQIESGRYGYTWVEDLRKSRTYLVLPAGETVGFYRYKKWFVIPDAGNRKHYFTLAAMRLLNR